MFPRTVADRWLRWTWLIAGIALLGAGALGVAHRAAHLGVPVVPHGAAHAHAHALLQVPASGVARVRAAAPESGHALGHDGSADCAAAHGSAASVSLFPEHDDGSEQCRLLDQLLHIDSLPGAAWEVSPPRVAMAPVCPAPLWRAAAARHDYLARGPPGA